MLTSSPDPPRRISPRAFGRLQVFVLTAGAGLTLLTVVVPAEVTRTGLQPELRLLIEVSCLFLALTAALVLSLTDPADLGPRRDGFIAALLVLAVTNALFVVVPAVADARLPIDRGFAFWPWVVSRFVAGVLVVAAGLRWPRLGLPRTLLVGIAVTVALNVVIVSSGERLPLVVDRAADGSTVIRSAGVLAVLMLVPAVLFGVGAWLTARLYVRGAAPLYAWLSVALSVQVFSQLHGMLAPAFLGPVVTSMDLFRTTSWSLLAAGAVAQLRYLYRARSHTAAVQAQDLDEQANVLEEQRRLSEREQDFRAVVSHELATPVAAIRAFAHVLASPAARSEQRGAALEGLSSEAHRLAELVERIEELRDLDIAGSSCVLRPVAVAPLLAEARAFAAGLPGRTDVLLRCDEDRVLADPVRIGQLLRNLLANAVRYSPPDIPIELVGVTADEGHYRIDVVDRGPGIAPEDRHRVIEPYARGAEAQGPGSGLGLHVAHRLAELHGGGLTLEDGPGGRGTCVRVTLRRAT